MENSLNLLARRSGFNAALRHFKLTNEYVRRLGSGANLADLLNADLDEGRIQRHQILPIINAVLVEKYGYAFRSYNLRSEVADAKQIAETVAQWTALDMVLLYHHPQAGVFVIEPTVADNWEEPLPLAKDELVVVYVGAAVGDVSDKVLRGAAEDMVGLLSGRKIKGKKSYIAPEGRGRAKPAPATRASVAEKPKAEAAEARPAARKMRMTSKIGVDVTNELFHNGNVEAWKRIIQSYKAKYPGNEVLIWYEGERINDINALFKWGKVKHGTPIMISVVGDEIKDVSKLRRYLYEGASPRFEAFLAGGIDRVLDLF